MRIARKLTGVFLILVLACPTIIAQQFTASYTAAASKEPFSGNVYLYLSKTNKNPKNGKAGMENFPCYSIAVKNIQPGKTVLFDDKAVSFPVTLSDIERGEYYVQAVWDKDMGGRAIANSPGNIYNNAIRVSITKKTNQVFSIVCNDVIKEKPFVETAFVKEERTPSAFLTAFYKRPTTIDAAVILPKEYEEQPRRKFPVLYQVSGYGGDYHNFSNSTMKSQPIDTTACIRVYLDGNCPLGHSAYTNSDNNGLWGDALIKELIPAIEQKYRTNAARLLTGHSSGGWTVLSLQINYPTTFAACWSSSPDPVDFRNFQTVDLYKDRNIFYDKDSGYRLVATVAGRIPWVTMKNMYGVEHVLVRGEQMHSFDAVFSTKNSDGTPRRLCDETTGAIDSVTVEHWKKYDICLSLKNNWAQLKPELQGKIRVTVGNQDNFLLNFAVQMLEEEMKKLSAGFIIEYYPGDHFTVNSPEYKIAGAKFLQEKYNTFIQAHPSN